jgi:NADH-quinone oxidoreductase subunit K
MIGIVHYTVVSGLLFILGLTTVMVRKNAVAILMGVELILNASALNFVAFSRFVGSGGGGGEITALFVIVLAVAEAAVALSIILNYFKLLGSANVDEADIMKG